MVKDGMAYKDQSAFSLRHTLIEGVIDLSSLNLIKSQSNVAGNFTVGLHIIGASHVAAFHWTDMCLTEIFACMDASGLGRMIHTEQQGLLGMSTSLKCCPPCPIGNVGYDFHSYLYKDNGAKDAMLKIEQDFEENGSGLIFEFPKEKDENIPKTIVFLHDIGENFVTIRTAHSYPNECLAVITETKVARE